ncbi:MAG: DNA mismatch repair protein MutS [Anaerolineae bacterium]|nr:DNA mismatch repair protein MutS [Anaerolineae bacterium]
MSHETPIRRQYLDLKAKYPGCVLFFRLGDFFEAFDADAELIARELDVTLTGRPMGKDTRIPMAGVPHHSAEGYWARLVERGYRVAIADQLGSDPVNGLVPREIRRVITPGTVVEPRMLDAARPSYLAAIVSGNGVGDWGAGLKNATADNTPKSKIQNPKFGLAYCDITTGEFQAVELNGAIELERELSRIQPREMLVEEQMPAASKAIADKPKHMPLSGSTRTIPLTHYPAYRFEIGNARQTVLAHFKTSTLAAFDLEDKPLALRAGGAILAYLREMQPAALNQILDLNVYHISQFMGLDEVTRRNLELVEPIRAVPAPRRYKPANAPSAPTLLGVLDKTSTPMGARLLRTWVSQPLLNLSEIQQRLDRVQALCDDVMLRANLREALKSATDLERLTSRAMSNIAQPRDLLSLKVGSKQAQKILDFGFSILNSQIDDLKTKIQALSPIIALIDRAIKDEPDDDGFIKPGHSAELDGIHLATRDAKLWVANLERVERERTGIKSLKVGYNQVFGYYIEITHANAGAAPPDYIRKQTLTNAERFITPKLKEYETIILKADERIEALEKQLLTEINRQVSEHARPLLDAAQQVARLDVAAALAEAASRNNYVRPQFSIDNAASVLHIVAGRHPVVEQLLTDAPFTPNDTHLDAEARIHIITGPNMSGKSTTMRQVALIALMAQIGSFVPAQSAVLPIVDRIFTRIGAQDDLGSGQSTFMVEMVETANILRHCSAKSLVLLDEIGRGTSTYDGLAIAWSVIEFLHNHPERRAMTLFATHYHELISLADTLAHVRNYNVAVSDEANGGRAQQIVFLHKVVAGGADRSYGVHVAELAGLPASVVSRARAILKDLEDGQIKVDVRGAARRPARNDVPQLALFTEESPALVKLRAIDPNTLSPIEALTLLYELKKLAG